MENIHGEFFVDSEHVPSIVIWFFTNFVVGRQNEL